MFFEGWVSAWFYYIVVGVLLRDSLKFGVCTITYFVCIFLYLVLVCALCYVKLQLFLNLVLLRLF